jgi:hypothetical protein
MRQLTSEIVNGAIFAALVVLTSEMQHVATPQRPAVPSQGSVAVEQLSADDARTVRTESFAASLARSSFAPDATREASATPPFLAVGERGLVPASGQVTREAVDRGAASDSAQHPAASPSQRVDAKAATSQIPDASKIDAYVPPIKRQRPVTPPLAFNAPAEKAAKSSAGKAAKAQVKRAAARKGQEAARSSLGAGTRAKVASEAALKAKQ